MLILSQVMMRPVPYSRESRRLDVSTVAPYICFRRSIVGRPRHQGVMVGMGQKDSYVGYVPTLAVVLTNSLNL